MSYVQHYYNVGAYRWTLGEIQSRLKAVSEAEKDKSVISADLSVAPSENIFATVSLPANYKTEGARTLREVGAILLDAKNQIDRAMHELFASAVWNYQKVNGVRVPPIEVSGKEVTVVWDTRAEVPVLSYSDITRSGSVAERAERRRPPPLGMMYDKEGYPIPASSVSASGSRPSAPIAMYDKNGNPIFVITRPIDRGDRRVRDKDGNPV